MTDKTRFDPITNEMFKKGIDAYLQSGADHDGAWRNPPMSNTFPDACPIHQHASAIAEVSGIKRKTTK